ncbi:ATP-dependent 6-phosphofructokinase [Lampropedia puyangensis]|uniref:ATP-dependent 6-phosphofructokinase n=1 Tax=Lampropedia puyangensis TaxID=1330072 RepID=A0A4S8FBI4_9BURK|nr:ATP-dependent 6-phosphofructokinase [Lampropedia puyangensis]THU04175.1 ATP-dependent 6-phosphofructokinase [Lampropedia puyangensis]
MHIGILTGGGDCPGLNAVVRAVTLNLLKHTRARITGIEKGFYGLIARKVRPLTEASVTQILHEGGSILGAHNSANPFRWSGAQGADVSGEVIAFARELGLDALVVIGGDGTMAIANRIHQMGLPVVGVPKTIDNDLMHTERTFGFDSAVAVVADSLQRLETTARSHDRVMILETMGRYAGWIALEGGIAGGAHAIVLPELPYDPETLANLCRQRQHDEGYTLICIAEGAKPKGGDMVIKEHLAHSPDPIRLGGVGDALRLQLQQRLDCEVRSMQLGHLQRGGSPTAFDCVLSTQFGWWAAEMVKQQAFGRMVVLQNNQCSSVPLNEVAGKIRHVPLDHPLVRTARSIGVSFGAEL